MRRPSRAGSRRARSPRPTSASRRRGAAAAGSRVTAPSRCSRSRKPSRACGSTKRSSVERAHVGVGGFGGEAEHQLEMRVGGDSVSTDVAVDRRRCRHLRGPIRRAGQRRQRKASVRAIVVADSMRMRRRRAGRILGRGTFRSMARRMSATGAPDACSCIAATATSMQMPQPMPCGLHSGRPSAERRATKQSSLLPWPLRSQPQKQGMCLSTSGCRAANS